MSVNDNSERNFIVLSFKNKLLKQTLKSEKRNRKQIYEDFVS